MFHCFLAKKDVVVNTSCLEGLEYVEKNQPERLGSKYVFGLLTLESMFRKQYSIGTKVRVRVRVRVRVKI